MKQAVPSLLLAVASLFLLISCEQNQPVHTTQFLAFGTLVDLTIAGTTRDRSETATEVIEKDFQQMHRSWHAWDPGPLGRVNRLIQTEKPFSVPPSVLPLIRRGQALSDQSDHLFNPAIGRLIDAWGFHSDDPDGHQPPAPELIAALLKSNPRMDDLKLNGIRINSENPSVKLDFGAFGKGYGIDMAIQHLQEMGIENAILNAGGDLRAIGSRNGTPWRIAIRHPSGKGVIASIQTLGNESIFTSGDYERNFTWKGKRYHHIIDPRTGYPTTGTASVTVIHNDSTTADAAATALFIAGPDQWHRIALQMGVHYVLLIDSAGRLHMNPAMKKRLELLDETRDIIISPPLTITMHESAERIS